MEPKRELGQHGGDGSGAYAPGHGALSSDGTPKNRSKIRGKIKFDSAMQRSEAVAYFGALVDGLKHGRLQFRHGEETLALSPAEQVIVEVKASRKGTKEKITFVLEWKSAAEPSPEAID